MTWHEFEVSHWITSNWSRISSCSERSSRSQRFFQPANKGDKQINRPKGRRMKGEADRRTDGRTSVTTIVRFLSAVLENYNSSPRRANKYEYSLNSQSASSMNRTCFRTSSSSPSTSSLHTHTQTHIVTFHFITCISTHTDTVFVISTLTTYSTHSHTQ